MATSTIPEIEITCSRDRLERISLKRQKQLNLTGISLNGLVKEILPSYKTACKHTILFVKHLLKDDNRAASSQVYLNLCKYLVQNGEKL